MRLSYSALLEIERMCRLHRRVRCNILDLPQDILIAVLQRLPSSSQLAFLQVILPTHLSRDECLRHLWREPALHMQLLHATAMHNMLSVELFRISDVCLKMTWRNVRAVSIVLVAQWSVFSGTPMPEPLAGIRLFAQSPHFRVFVDEQAISEHIRQRMMQQCMSTTFSAFIVEHGDIEYVTSCEVYLAAAAIPLGTGPFSQSPLYVPPHVARLSAADAHAPARREPRRMAEHRPHRYMHM